MGRGAVAAPLLMPGMAAASALPAQEALMSMLLSSGLYADVDDIWRKFGILPDLLP